MKYVIVISLVALLGVSQLPIQTTMSDIPVVEEEILVDVKQNPVVVDATEVDLFEEDTTVEPQYEIVLNEDEIIALAKMAWGEARGTSDMEVAATMWCVLNRVDDSGDSIIEVITAPYQFVGYGSWCPVEDRLYNLAVDVLTRWQKEKQGASPEEVGRVLPAEYLWFHGDGQRNHFRDSFTGGTRWNWDCENPYETEEVA